MHPQVNTFAIIFGCILILIYIKHRDLAFNRLSATLCKVHSANRSRCCCSQDSCSCGLPLDRCSRSCCYSHHDCTCSCRFLNHRTHMSSPIHYLLNQKHCSHLLHRMLHLEFLLNCFLILLMCSLMCLYNM